MTRFKDLALGQHFDFIDDARPTFNSFYLRCRKLSARKYMDETGTVHHVGSIGVKVYHVETRPNDQWTGYPDPTDPDNYWIDDATGERIKAV